MKSSEKRSSDRRPMRPWLWFAGSAVLVLLVLVLTVWVVICLHDWLISHGQTVADLGVVGDMFGVATALFSGLAFAGLIIVLVYERRERDRDLADRLESRRPLLTVRFDQTGPGDEALKITVSRAEPDGARGVDLRLDINVPVHALADVALKPVVSIVILVRDSVVWNHSLHVGLPINSGGTRLLQFVAQQSGPKGHHLLSCLERQQHVRLRAVLEYESVSGAHWQTAVEADVQISPEDVGISQQVLAGTGVVDKGTAARIASLMKTDLTVDPTTWTHGRVSANVTAPIE